MYEGMHVFRLELQTGYTALSRTLRNFTYTQRVKHNHINIIKACTTDNSFYEYFCITEML